MNILQALNPVNRFKSAAAKFVADRIDETLTLENGKSLLVAGINKAVTMAEQKWGDGECATYSRGLRLAGKALNDLAEAIDPEGEDGHRMSVSEFEVLLGDAQAAFGALVTEEWAQKVRDDMKSLVADKLGV